MRKRAVAATSAVLALGLRACGDRDTGDEALRETGRAAGADGSTAEPFGPGCPGLPRSARTFRTANAAVHVVSKLVFPS